MFSQVCVILYIGRGRGGYAQSHVPSGGVFLVPDPFRMYTGVGGGNIPLEGTLPLPGADI